MYEGDPSAAAAASTAAAVGRVGEEMAFSAVDQTDRWHRGRLAVVFAAAAARLCAFSLEYPESPCGNRHESIDCRTLTPPIDRRSMDIRHYLYYY